MKKLFHTALAEMNRYLRDHIRCGEDGGGELVLRCSPAELAWCAQVFGGLGAEVEILKPPALRALLYELGSQLAAR